MSFNTQHCLNYVERKIDFDIMAKAILDCGADIVGLNEIRGEGMGTDYTAQTERLSELTGLGYYYFAPAIEVKNGGPYGNAFLSKIPILKAETVMIPDPVVKQGGRYETRCILKVLLEGGITVLVTHFGLNPDEQENAVKTVVANITDEKCILMGDFNVVPENSMLAPIRESCVIFACVHVDFEPVFSYGRNGDLAVVDYQNIQRSHLFHGVFCGEIVFACAWLCCAHAHDHACGIDGRA